MSEGMSGGTYPNRKWPEDDRMALWGRLRDAEVMAQQAKAGWDESRLREAELRAELGFTRGVLKDIQDYAEAEFREGEKGYQLAIVARETLAGQPLSGWTRTRSECPVCYDGIDPDANGYCGSCGWSPISDPPAMLDVNDSAFRTRLMKPAQDETQDSWQGVYPGMCADPETCRGYSHCPRPYSCSE
jgi:hypothetical protein